MQSADGLAPFAALAQARHEHGTTVLLDTTQATGWLPVPTAAVDLLISGGYKWAAGPAGSAFGTLPALELIAGVGLPAIHAHDVALANRFRAGLGLPASDSAIVSIPVDEPGRPRCGARAWSPPYGPAAAASPSTFYDTESDVDTALAALTEG